MKLSKILCAAALAIAPSVAFSATMDSGLYDVTDIDRNGEGGPRSVWTPNGNKIVSGGGASWAWNFENVTLDYAGLGAGVSTLSGQMVNRGNDNIVLDINMTFSGSVADNRQGYCQFPDDGPTTCEPLNTIDDDWSYLTYTSGTFSGTGDLAGYVWDVFSNPTHLPQLGFEANALLHNGLDGFSMWFTYDLRGTTQDVLSSVATGPNTRSNVWLNDLGSGDINSNVSAVPLPAPALMLLSALAMAGAAARRKKA